MGSTCRGRERSSPFTPTSWVDRCRLVSSNIDYVDLADNQHPDPASRHPGKDLAGKGIMKAIRDFTRQVNTHPERGVRMHLEYLP